MTYPPLYLLSGLCADERLFQFLQLRHPNPKMIRWITAAPQDTMVSYASKLLAQIEPGQEPPLLVGLSFGGMVAQEIAKQIPVKRVVLLSSLPNARELPFHYRLAGSLQPQKWLPFGLFKYWMAPANWIFGAHSASEKKILMSIIKEADVPYLRWCLTQILHWKLEAKSDNLVVIHGDKDKVLPVPKFPKAHILPGGEHLMVISRAAEISALLNQYLT